MFNSVSNEFAINFIIRRNSVGVSVTSPDLPVLKFTADNRDDALKMVDAMIRKELNVLCAAGLALPIPQPTKPRYRRWKPNAPTALKLFLYQTVQAMSPLAREAWIANSTSSVRRKVGPIIKRSMLSPGYGNPPYMDLVIEQLEMLGCSIVAHSA